MKQPQVAKVALLHKPALPLALKRAEHNKNLDLDIVAVVHDTATKNQLMEFLNEFGGSNFEVSMGSLGGVVERIRKTGCPSSLIVDISDESSPISNLEVLASNCDPNVKVIVLGDYDNIALYRDILAMGATDYLVKPVSRELLLDALHKGDAEKPALHFENSPAQTIAVYGIRGGVGATTVVANIGWVLANIFDHKVAMTDFNLCNGSLALDLGLASSSVFSDLLMDPSRIDEVFVKRTTQVAGKNLAVLCSDGGLDRSPDIAADSLSRLMDILKIQYQFVIQDLPRSSYDQSIELLNAADSRILVINKTLAAVRDCRRLISRISNQDNRQTLVILNNITQSTRNDVPLLKIQTFIKHPVDLIIPYEKYRMAAAHLQGNVASISKGPIRTAFKEMASKIVDPNNPLPRSGNWLAAVMGR